MQPEGEGSAMRDNATHQNLCDGFNTAFEVLEPCKITRVQRAETHSKVLEPCKITRVQSI